MAGSSGDGAMSGRIIGDRDCPEAWPGVRNVVQTVKDFEKAVQATAQRDEGIHDDYVEGGVFQSLLLEGSRSEGDGCSELDSCFSGDCFARRFGGSAASSDEHLDSDLLDSEEHWEFGDIAGAAAAHAPKWTEAERSSITSLALRKLRELSEASGCPDLFDALDVERALAKVEEHDFSVKETFECNG